MEEYLVRAVMEHVDSGITIADATHPDVPLVFVNKGFERITGYSSAESVGISCRFLQGSETDQEGLGVLRDALRRKEPCVVRLRNYRKDGSLFYNELHLSPVIDEAGSVTHFVGIQHDVSEQVRTRNALEASERRLKEALAKEKELNEIKSAFISMISHEFRTPMTGIQTSAALLRRFGDQFPEDKKQRHFDNVESSLRRMNRLIDDVLFFSRAEANKLDLHPDTVDLDDYLHNLVERMDPIYQDRNIRINSSYLEQGIFHLDTHMLDHILFNLVGNAFKYSATGSPVDVLVREMEEQLVITIRDHGIGIPEEDRETLFEPFHRARNVETRQGTGLGLHIARRAARLLGGDISFKSRETIGSTFETVILKNCPKADQP